jgi:Mn2+/Fe2+ NRAMP family transporter
MNFSGAFGGAIAGTLVALFMFTGLNLITLVPVTVIIVLSMLIGNYRAKQAMSAGIEDLPVHE